MLSGKAGMLLANNTLDLQADFNVFLANLQQVLQTMKICILRMESFDPETGDITLIVGQRGQSMPF